MHSFETRSNISIPNSATEPPVLSARELTSGGQIARIVLDDQTYTLRITRAAKLILTK